MPDRPIPRQLAVALAAAAVLAGLLAAVAPAASLGLVVTVAAVALLARLPLPRLGVVGVVAAAVAAILGPTLALPGLPQAFAFRIVMLLLAAGLAVYLLLGGDVVVPRGMTRPAALLIGLTAWSTVSIIWAADTAAGIRWTVFLLMMGGLAVAIPLACRSRRNTVRLLIALGVTFVAATLIGFAETRLGISLPTTTRLGTGDSAFSASLFGNQNNFATYLTLTLPWFLCMPVAFRDARLVLLGTAGGVLTFAALMFTGSRSNLVAAALVIGGLVAFVLTGGRRSGGRAAAITVVALAAVLVVPSVTGNGILPIPQEAVEKFNVVQLLEQRRQQIGSGAVREAVLVEGGRLVVQSGGLGVGAGNAESRISALDSFTGVQNLHNWWMELLVDLGVVGLALFVAMYAHLLRGQWRAARRTADPLVRWMALSGALALLGFVVGSMGPSSVIHFAPMWITLGLGMLTLVHARAERP